MSRDSEVELFQQPLRTFPSFTKATSKPIKACMSNNIPSIHSSYQCLLVCHNAPPVPHYHHQHRGPQMGLCQGSQFIILFILLHKSVTV